MTVYKHQASPYWHYEFQHNKVRYYGSTGCTSRRDAERVERDKRSDAAIGIKQQPSLTVDEAAGIYWANRGTFESARKTTEYQLGNLIRLIGANTALHDLDDLTISRFVSRRRGERSKTRGRGLVSAATVNREVELLKRVVNHVRGTYRAPDIAWGKHKLKEPVERIRHASPDEEARLFAALSASDHDLADLVEFALISGVRKNAAVTLLWSKVDLRQRTATVHTKGDVWHTFPLSTRLLEIIANRPKVGPYVFTYLCRQSRAARTDKMGRKEAPRRKGERYPYSKQGWDRRWRKVLADAGIDNFRFHDLRHTAATRIARQGGLKVAQQLLGHTRIETTARYAHVERADILDAMENAAQHRQESRNSPEAAKAKTPEIVNKSIA